MKVEKLVDDLKVAIDTSPRPKAPWHPGSTENRYLGGNFAPVLTEITAFGLQVHGRVPDELEGRLLRIGPNPIAKVDPTHTSNGSRRRASCMAYACAAGVPNGIAAATQ